MIMKNGPSWDQLCIPEYFQWCIKDSSGQLISTSHYLINK